MWIFPSRYVVSPAPIRTVLFEKPATNGAGARRSRNEIET